MSDDWQPGDLALVVNRKSILCSSGIMHCGENIASAPCVVQIARLVSKPCGCVGLVLTTGHRGIASRFRKVRPHTPDAEDAETIALLTGGKVTA